MTRSGRKRWLASAFFAANIVYMIAAKNMPMFFGKTLPSRTLRFNAYKVSLNFFKIRPIIKGDLVILKMLIKVYKVRWIWLRVLQLRTYLHQYCHTQYARIAYASFFPINCRPESCMIVSDIVP